MKNKDFAFWRYVAKVVIPICAIVLWLSSCVEWPNREDFSNRGKAYYAALAQACSGLLSQTNQIGGVQSLAGDDKSLPKILLELHATTIEVHRDYLVGTNNNPHVTIIFGEGRAGYGVIWEQNDYGKGYRPWELSIAGDFEPAVLFSTTNAPLP
jgi:hypothetical protein